MLATLCKHSHNTSGARPAKAGHEAHTTARKAHDVFMSVPAKGGKAPKGRQTIAQGVSPGHKNTTKTKHYESRQHRKM
jgi:hypothetical protein